MELRSGSGSVVLREWENGHYDPMAPCVFADHDSSVSFSFPFSEDVLGSDRTLKITGTVREGVGFKGYVMDYGEGPNPKSWSTAGIHLQDQGKKTVENGLLGSWDARLLPRSDRTYTLRIRATYASGVDVNFARNLHFDGTLKKGWPVRIPSTIKPGSDSAYDSVPAPVVVDLDGDGRKEVVVLRGGGDAPLWAKVIAYNSDGTTRWVRALKGCSLYWYWSAPPLVYDLDMDGKLEIFVPSLNDGWIFALQPDGTMKQGWPVRHTVESVSHSKIHLVTGDVDGDGHAELVVVDPHSEWQGGNERTAISVYMFAADGTAKRSWTLTTPGSPADNHQFQAALGNFDPSPGLEIVFGVSLAFRQQDSTYYGGRAWICKWDGTVLPGWPVRFINALGGSLVVADLNGDGRDEAIFSLTKSTSGSDGGLWVLDSKARTLPGWSRRRNRSMISSPAVGDVDGDGKPEVVTLDYYDGAWAPEICVLRTDGSILSGWPRPAPSYSNFGCMLADVDGDEVPEILVDYFGDRGAQVPGSRGRGHFGPADSLLLGLPFSSVPSSLDSPGVSTFTHGSVIAHRLDGSIAQGFPKQMNTGNSWTSIADLDADGKLELVGASYHEYSPWKESYPRRAGSIYVWELDGPCDANNMPWPRFQRDSGHTGRFQLDPPEGVCAESPSRD